MMGGSSVIIVGRLHKCKGHMPSSSACHQVYVLSLWRETEHAPWRAALRRAGHDERLGFADLEALALFLLRLDEAAPAADEATQADNA